MNKALLGEMSKVGTRSRNGGCGKGSQDRDSDRGDDGDVNDRCGSCSKVVTLGARTKIVECYVRFARFIIMESARMFGNHYTTC